MGKRVLVAMSGGVDSAVSALLLKRAGYEPTGVTFKMQTGAPESDIRDAATVADALGIEHRVADLSESFKREVEDRFAESYLRGETPNPCVECNRRVKMKSLCSLAGEWGFELAATGHYARTEYGGGRYRLLRAIDISKDQSYVLYALSQDILKMLVLPLGGLTKSEARALAAESGLANASKRDSQDICFIPDGDYASFIEREYGVRGEPGNFLSEDGKILGRHRGLIRYTTGQRRGLGVSADRPLYVLRKDLERNAVVLGDDGELYKKSIYVRHINMVSIPELTGPARAEVKIRYSQRTAAALLTPDGGGVSVEFDEPQRAPTSGQSAVFYDGETVLGGGVIA